VRAAGDAGLCWDGLYSLAKRRIEQGIGVDGSSLPDARPAVATSLTDLQSQFAARKPLSPDELSRLADRLPHLRQRYNEQLQRARIQFVDPRLKLASCRRLLDRARSAVSVSQLVYQAMRSLENAHRTRDQAAVAPEIVEAAIEWNAVQIERIGSQLQVLDVADPQAAWLKVLFEQLDAETRVPLEGWKTLAQQALSTAANAHPGCRLPLPDLSLQSYLTEIGFAHYAEAVGRGIEAAGVVAWLMMCGADKGMDWELLTLAALCQDCGLLRGQRSRPASPSAASTQLRDLHPSIGAGLIAGLAEFSTELPALVAQHHWRLNDPRIIRGLAGPVQNRASRWLVVIVRWLELVDECRPAIESKASADGPVFGEPARRLLRETLRGDWDRQRAGELLAALDFREESERLRAALRTAPAFENRDGRHRRLDDADELWPEPNLEPAPRSREKHHVRASAE
jgi:hypothetical protein